MKQSDTISSISYDQEEIIKNIVKLYIPEGVIEIDPTFSKGNFYKNIPKPLYYSDIAPQTKVTVQCDCTHLPFTNEQFNSAIFDPPFLIGVGKTECKKGSNIIKNRFGSFKTPKELWQFYNQSLSEFYRILKPDGILIFKMQDTVSSRKQYLSHIEIINYAYKIGFYPLDIFILLAKNRIIGPVRNQEHSRKYHSYMVVFKKQKCPVKYSINCDIMKIPLDKL
jgi:hypothetical protein